LDLEQIGANSLNDINQIKSDLKTKNEKIDPFLSIPEHEWNEKISESTNLDDTLLSKLEQLIAINNEQSPVVKMERLIIFSDYFDNIDVFSLLHGPEVQMWFENLEELKKFLNEYEQKLIEERKKQKTVDSYLK
jgi:hypothetical protein